MPVERVNGYLEFKGLGITPSLGTESACIEQSVSDINIRNWSGVFGFPSFRFFENSLNFLFNLAQLIPELLRSLVG